MTQAKRIPQVSASSKDRKTVATSSRPAHGQQHGTRKPLVRELKEDHRISRSILLSIFWRGRLQELPDFEIALQLESLVDCVSVGDLDYALVDEIGAIMREAARRLRMPKNETKKVAKKVP